MFWTPKENVTRRPNRRPNRYLFGANIFAEWREENGKEGWSFYVIRPRIAKNDPIDLPKIVGVSFFTDTDENAKTLLDKLDPGFAPNE